TPHAIEQRFGLRKPIYLETASYGHFGRQPRKVSKVYKSRYMGDKTVEVELFGWEKLDMVDAVKASFGLK
ncbi:MAG: methionine adenosyltransferase, partial [Muribaculaceae bacterium]|nr:methionine adenosyltransferase [Muribaculaceae bacterium]